MRRDVVIPRLGSSDESDEVRGSKPKGLSEKGEALLEVETDKINVEIESLVTGRFKKSGHGKEFVKFGATIAVVEKGKLSRIRPCDFRMCR
jgi:hypothetical protein